MSKLNQTHMNRRPRQLCEQVESSLPGAQALRQRPGVTVAEKLEETEHENSSRQAKSAQGRVFVLFPLLPRWGIVVRLYAYVSLCPSGRKLFEL